MNKLFSTFYIAAIAVSASAQVSFGDLPATVKAGKTVNVEPEVLYQQIVASEQIRIDEERRIEEHLPMRIAKRIDVDYEFNRDGEWHRMPNGDEVWLLRVRSEGALALIPSYSDFFLPRGVQLFVYNQSRTQILGSYTYDTHPCGGIFANEMVAGDDITFEVVIPHAESHLKSQVRLCISGIGYCYNGVRVKTIPNLQMGESGYCMINVNASEGDDWQTEKKGVAQMTMLLDDGWYVCSGTMINTTAQDLRPYLLSACHCYNYKASAEDMLQWIFKFHYEAPGAIDAEPLDTRTLVGCRLLAATSMKAGSDGLLLELSEEVPLEWNVYFNGWDRRDTINNGRGVCIHHPAGDIKKISTFQEYHDSQWVGEGGPGMDSAHWVLKFIKTANGHGVTEGGSSGSPLFNHDHLVIGTLTGGDASCARPTGDNYFGKLAYHWDQIGDSLDTRFAEWLDPLHLGVDTLRGTFFDPDAPRIEVTGDDVLELDGDVGAPGEGVAFGVSGFNLTGRIAAYAPEHFQVSADGVVWADSASIDSQGGRFLVRYDPHITGNHYGNVVVSSPEVRLARYVGVHASCCREVSVSRELPNAEIQQAYAAQINLTSQDGPFVVELGGGSLPRGLAIDSAGLISGLPLEDGIFDFVIHVTDAFGCVTSAPVTLYVKSLVVSSYPFVEDFELEDFGGIWKQTYTKGNIAWQMGKGINEDYVLVTAPKSGALNALFFDKSYDANTTLLVSPQLDFSGVDTATLHFWYLLPDWNGDIDEMNVYYRNSVTSDWILLKNYKEDAPVWTEQALGLPELSEEYFVAFEAIGHYGYGIAIDDVSFTINDEASIRFTIGDASLPVEIYSASGQRMSFDLDALPKGVYLIRSQNGESSKLIK